MPGILQVVHGWPPRPGRDGQAHEGRVGGTELYAHCLFTTLMRRMASWAFVAGELGSSRRVHDDGAVRTVHVTASDTTSFRDSYRRPWVESVFREWLALTRPDVVHFHHLAWLSLGLPRVAAESGALVVMTLHDYWLACPRGQLVNSEGKRCLGPTVPGCTRCLGGQLGLGPLAASLSRAMPGLPRRMRTSLRDGPARWLATSASPQGRSRGEHIVEARLADARQAVNHVHRFLSPSSYLAGRFAENAFIEVLGHLPIEVMALPLLQPVEAQAPADPGPVRLLFLGSLIPTKGPHLLLEAFARLPAGAATLRLAGPKGTTDLDPQYHERLSRRASELPGVELHPAYPHGSVSQHLAVSDVLVVPSIWEENSPLVVREARAGGLRVLASRRGGIPELAPESRWFEPDDPASLLLALQAEVREGRQRWPLAAWPDPQAHAEQLLTLFSRWHLSSSQSERASPCYPPSRGWPARLVSAPG